MTSNDFHTAMYQALLLYNVSFSNPDEFEEIALIGYGRIGNKRTRLYRYITKIPKTLEVELPCNCEIIEAVTYPWEDWNYVTGIHPNGDVHSSFTELYIESRKEFTNPLYLRGKYADYERVGNKLYFQKPYGDIIILYKGLELDDDGLPIINDKEVDALAAWCAYVKLYKEGIATKNANIIQLAKDIQQTWYRLCSAAQVPEELTLNDMNNILDVKTCWDRKRYNRKYTPVK